MRWMLDDRQQHHHLHICTLQRSAAHQAVSSGDCTIAPRRQTAPAAAESSMRWIDRSIEQTESNRHAKCWLNDVETRGADEINLGHRSIVIHTIAFRLSVRCTGLDGHGLVLISQRLLSSTNDTAAAAAIRFGYANFPAQFPPLTASEVSDAVKQLHVCNFLGDWRQINFTRFI